MLKIPGKLQRLGTMIGLGLGKWDFGRRDTNLGLRRLKIEGGAVVTGPRLGNITHLDDHKTTGGPCTLPT